MKNCKEILRSLKKEKSDLDSLLKENRYYQKYKIDPIGDYEKLGKLFSQLLLNDGDKQNLEENPTKKEN